MQQPKHSSPQWKIVKRVFQFLKALSIAPSGYFAHNRAYRIFKWAKGGVGGRVVGHSSSVFFV
jgi:hypothetical protein